MKSGNSGLHKDLCVQSVLPSSLEYLGFTLVLQHTSLTALLAGHENRRGKPPRECIQPHADLHDQRLARPGQPRNPCTPTQKRNFHYSTVFRTDLLPFLLLQPPLSSILYSRRTQDDGTNNLSPIRPDQLAPLNTFHTAKYKASAKTGHQVHLTTPHFVS